MTFIGDLDLPSLLSEVLVTIDVALVKSGVLLISGYLRMSHLANDSR